MEDNGAPDRRSRQYYDLIRAGDHKALNLQNEGSSSSAYSTPILSPQKTGNARHTGGESLSIAIERLSKYSTTTKNKDI